MIVLPIKCLANNITPWATLYHWDLPQVLEDKGGWTNRDIVKWFSDYIHVMLSKLGDRIQHWMVLNEPLVFTGAGYFLGVHAPGRRGMDNFLAATHHAALAQATGIKIIKQFQFSNFKPVLPSPVR
jgi:beta-glucosidase